MKIALNAKNKLSFVDGSLLKPTTSSTDIRLCERYNDMVLSWMLNSIDKSIVDSLINVDSPRAIWLDLQDHFSQSNNPASFNSNVTLYLSLRALSPSPIISPSSKATGMSFWCFKRFPLAHVMLSKKLNRSMKLKKKFQFLMVLHDSFAFICSHFLAKDPLPPC